MWPRVDSDWDKRFTPILFAPGNLRLVISHGAKKDTEETQWVLLVCSQIHICRFAQIIVKILVKELLRWGFKKIANIWPLFSGKEHQKFQSLKCWAKLSCFTLYLGNVRLSIFSLLDADPASIFLQDLSLFFFCISVRRHVATHVLALHAQLVQGCKMCLAVEEGNPCKSKS